MDFVREHLPWSPKASIQVRYGDAREVVGKLPGGLVGSADLLIVDIFGGAGIPGVTSLEFYTAAIETLAPDGIVLVNIADGPPLQFGRAQAATLQAAIGEVAVLAETSVLKGRRYGNLVLVGSRQPLPLTWMPRLLAAGPHPAKVVAGARAAGLHRGGAGDHRRDVDPVAATHPRHLPGARLAPRAQDGEMKARIVGVGVAALLLAGCTQPAPVVTSAQPTPTASTTPTAIPQPPLQPVGEPVTIVGGLNAPWSIVRLESGSALISERDTALIRELQADGTLRDVAQVPNVRPDGEGGLLGMVFTETDGAPWLYTYFTSLDSDNRIVRFPLVGDAGSYSLGPGAGDPGRHRERRQPQRRPPRDRPRRHALRDLRRRERRGKLARSDLAEREDPAAGARRFGALGQPDRRLVHLVVRAPEPAGPCLGRAGQHVGGRVRAEHLGRDQPDPPGPQLRLATGRGHRATTRSRTRATSGRPTTRARAG